MGKYSLEITNKAKQDLAIHYKSGNKTIMKKIELIFNELEIHPTSGNGKPEQL